jgi:hypothetical protein
MQGQAPPDPAHHYSDLRRHFPLRTENSQVQRQALAPAQACLPLHSLIPVRTTNQNAGLAASHDQALPSCCKLVTNITCISFLVYFVCHINE